jgi:diguanylate cyclase (GGDEF)-like protein/PAS domain S-box-containing protein
MNTLSNHAEDSIKILVIDDDDVDREKILRLLKKIPMQVQVKEGSSAKDAINFINQFEFDCAILDYQLKDALGSEIVSLMKQQNVRPVAIIMVSNNTDQQLVANVVRDGVFDYLPKQHLGAENLHQSLVNGLEWAHHEQKIKEETQRLAQLSQGLPQLIWSCDPQGNCEFLNQKWLNYTGKAITQHLGQGWIEAIHLDDQPDFLSQWLSCLKTKTPFFAKSRILNEHGEYQWFDIRSNPHEDSNNKVIRWLCSATNIHELEIIHRALAASENQFHACFDNSPVPMILINEAGSLIQHNASFRQLLQDDKHSLIHSIEEILNDKNYLDFQDKIKDLQLLSKTNIEFETLYITRDDRKVPALVYAAIIDKHENPSLFLLQIFDLTDRKNREQELIRLAHFDTLTHLINRTKLYEELDDLIRRFDRHKIPFAILFCDLDNFKQINDGFGHDIGDYVLRIVARRLKKLLRQDDLIARLGGDEFIIVLDSVNRYEVVASIANKILQTICRPIRILASQKVHINLSLGIALFPTDGLDAATLLRNADSALYEAKNSGRGQFQLYRKELTEFVHNRLQLDAELRKAITNNQFELYFQPVVNLSNNKIVSAEALIRWHHPKRGLVCPGEFIAYAEESDLINRIGHWVINDAAKCVSEINQQGFNIPIAINISARQFQQGDIINQFKSAFKAYNVFPDQFTIEITEQIFLERTEFNIQQISRLKECGFKISLDDFGVGFSSLGYIVRFTPDQLKIDRSFINQIGKAKEHDEMVRAIIGLSKIIPMKIIAEGVETDSQKWFLIENECDFAQGYFFYRPMPLSNLIKLLSTQALN